MMRTKSGFLLLILALLAPAAALAQGSTFQLGEVLGLRYSTLTEGEPEAFEKRAIEVNYSFYSRHVPGIDWVLLKGDRGARKGTYAWFYNIDNLERRNFYWPQEEGPFPVWDTVMAVRTAEFGEAPFSGFSGDGENVGDYVLVGSETVPEMPWIDLLGIHHIRVKPGQEGAFERFVTEKWNPNAHVPGTWMLVYKADRGERKGGYALVYAFESRRLRDAYFPQPNEMTPEAQHAFRPVESLSEELQSYLGDPMETEYTDFALVR